MDRIQLQMQRVNGLTLTNAVLAIILVGVGNYGRHYRHRDFVRALFIGANTLFLPILSYVASNASNGTSFTSIIYLSQTTSVNNGSCDGSEHLYLVLVWAGLVHIVGINTCTIVAASKREGRIIGLPMVLLVQAVWSAYLVLWLVPPYLYFNTDNPFHQLLPIIFVLIFTKISFRFYEFQKARYSFAFGRNPPLIVGYMKKLQEGSNHGSIPQPVCPPPLIVMGEDRDEVEKGVHGFFFKRMCHYHDANMTGSSDLVTINKVWLLDDMVLTSTPWLKKVCLSFSLFKLLRCRFAGYTVAEAGFKQVRGFFLDVLLKEKDHERVHGVITDELSFLHDYYYSSIPIHYSNFWLPIVNISISLLTISYCLFAGMSVSRFIWNNIFHGKQELFQVYCTLGCHPSIYYTGPDDLEDGVGNLVYDVVPVVILLVLVALAEAWEIASYIYSNWTKVALFSSCVVNNHDAWLRSPRMQRWIGHVLQCRPNKLMTHWEDKIYQCSVLVPHPRRIDPVISFVMRLLHFPDRKRNVKVSGVLKARIFNALTSNNGLLTVPKTFLHRILEDDGIGSCSSDFLWACESEGISDLLLTWHIATSILEMRQGQGQQHPPRLSDDMIVATHLSRYCAYLVAYVPELLPDDDEWSKSLYKAVKKDCTRVLASTAEASTRYRKLMSLLQEPEPKHHVVLMNSVKLGEQLVNKLLQQGEATLAWKFLAGFWSQMILYIAPSDNLKGHAEAIARGGELITLVWALLMNVGISSRPSTGEGSSATADGV